MAGRRTERLGRICRRAPHDWHGEQGNNDPGSGRSLPRTRARLLRGRLSSTECGRFLVSCGGFPFPHLVWRKAATTRVHDTCAPVGPSPPRAKSTSSRSSAIAAWPQTTRNLDRSKSPEAQLRRRRRKLSRCGAKMLRPARRSCGGSRVKMRWVGAPPGRSGCRQHPSLTRIRPRLASAMAVTTARPGPAWLDR